MILCPNRLPESERVCPGICTLCDKYDTPTYTGHTQRGIRHPVYEKDSNE